MGYHAHFPRHHGSDQEIQVITTLGTPNSSEPAAFIKDTFDSSISRFRAQSTGTWTISSGKVKTTNQGTGILPVSQDVYVANYRLKVTVPADQRDTYAGLVVAHDGATPFTR